MSLITVVGMFGGLAVYLIARRGQKVAARLLLDQRAGRIGPREAAQARLQQKERSLLLGKGVCVFLGLLLLAALGRAAVEGEWGGTTVYYVAVFGTLLTVSAFTLRRAAADAAQARAELEQQNR